MLKSFIILMLFFNLEFKLVYTRTGRKDSEFVDYVGGSDGYSRKRGIEELIKHTRVNRTKLLAGYDLVTRQIIVNIRRYITYMDPTVFEFSIMDEVSDAQFTFQTEDVHMNAVGHCKPKDVIINIKRASYPAVNPDNYNFPKDFISPTSREQIHTINMLSNGTFIHYGIKNPKPGSWFGLVYLKWEDPKKMEIEQKGLSPICNRILYTHLQVKREKNVKFIDCYNGLVINYINLPADFKCMTLDSTDPVVFDITVTNITTESDIILFRVQALTFPSEEEHLLTCIFNPMLSNVQTIIFSPFPKAWHYIHLDRTSSESKYAKCSWFYPRPELEELKGNHTIFKLTRDDKGRFFAFEYEISKSNIRNSSSLINITSDEIKTVRFEINQFIDIGGSLVIKANLLTSMCYGKTNDLLDSTNRKSFTVICIGIGYASIPLKTGQCKFNNNITPALLVLNYSNATPFTSIIPYPDSGTWYLTLRLFCNENIVSPYRLSHDSRKHCLSDKSSDENIEEDNSEFIRRSQTNRESTVVLSVSSKSCLDEKCSHHGKCMFKSQDMAISFCTCFTGYGGWDCSDTSRMDSKFDIICSVLLLTLSNILFLITIYAAIIRHYYTEAMMYTFTMFSSTFYHACDSHEMVAMCLIRVQFLQFCDIFCAILCFWVTLLAVSIITDQLRMLLQLFGAVLVAILAALDAYSIKTFAVPVGLGVTVLTFSWFWDYSNNNNFRYPRLYYKIHLPIGLFLVGIALVCYAFLETEQNYFIVHSIWHSLIALSVSFVLPDIKREGSRNPFLPSPDCFHTLLFRRFNRAQTPLTPPLAPLAQPLV